MTIHNLKVIIALLVCIGLSFGTAENPLIVWMSGGVITESSKNRKMAVGGEISIFAMNENMSVPPWIGLYAHTLHRNDILDFSIGPEIGVYCFGVTGGYLRRIDNGVVTEGTTLRLHLSFIFIHPYIKFNYLDDREFSGGIALKFPVTIYGDNEFFYEWLW